MVDKAVDERDHPPTRRARVATLSLASEVSLPRSALWIVDQGREGVLEQVVVPHVLCRYPERGLVLISPGGSRCLCAHASEVGLKSRSKVVRVAGQKERREELVVRTRSKQRDGDLATVGEGAQKAEGD